MLNHSYLDEVLEAIGLSSRQAGRVAPAMRRTFVRAARSIKIVPVIYLAFGAAAGRAEVLDIKTFGYFAQQCGSTVATLTLAAIAKTESSFETLAVADNSTGRSRTYRTLDQAASAASGLIAKGSSVDLGLMQINSANLKRLGMSVRDVLEPCGAVRAAATIMSENFKATRRAANWQVALKNAISMYNTGSPTRGHRNGYVQRVEDAGMSLAAHFTPNVPARLALNVPRRLSVVADQLFAPWDVWRSQEMSVSPSGRAQGPDSILVF